MYKLSQELRSDNLSFHKNYLMSYIYINFLEKKEFLIVFKKIINYAYIFLEKSHILKLFKYKFLYMIYKKLDKAYNYIYLFFPDIIMTQF